MKKAGRYIAAVAAIAIALCSVVNTNSATVLTSQEMVQLMGGGFWCSAAEGATFILGIAGFFNPGFGIAALVLGAGTLFLC